MSRGLGTIERFILDRLQEDGISDTWSLAYYRNQTDDDPAFQPSPSQYEGTRRAVQSLKRKGLVTTQWSSNGERRCLVVELATPTPANHEAPVTYRSSSAPANSRIGSTTTSA